ncbi:hypothetical protein L1887_58356 [Cichorium endivia]|nr:hypothetical protein L1887_58356 [Cichorium endivia]
MRTFVRKDLYTVREEGRGIMIASLGALVEHHGKQRHTDVHAVLDLAPPRRARVVLEAQQLHQAVHRAAVLEVAHHGDRQSSHGTHLLADGKRVEQSLRRVLDRRLATRDHGHGRVLGSQMHAPRLGVAHDHRIRVAAQRADRVRDRLALLHRRLVRLHLDHLSTQAQHGRLERARRARRLLVEQRSQHTAAQQVHRTLSLHQHAHLGSHREERVQVFTSEALDRQDVAARKRRVVQHRPDRRSRHRRQRRRLVGERSHQAAAARLRIGACAQHGRSQRQRERSRRRRRLLSRDAWSRRGTRSGSRERHAAASRLGLLGNRGHVAHVAAERGVREHLAIHEHRLGLERHAVDRAHRGARLERRPVVAAHEGGRAVDLHLDLRVRLRLNTEHLLGLGVQPAHNVVQRQAALVDRVEQQQQRLLDTRLGRSHLADLLGQLVRRAADREHVDVLQVLPQRLLVVCRGQARSLRVHLGGEEERVDGNVARHLQTLGLAESDQLDVVARQHVGHVDRTVVQAGEQQHRSEIRVACVRHDRSVRRPRGEVRGDGGRLDHVRAEAVERDEQRARAVSQLVDRLGVVHRRGNTERDVAVRTLGDLALSRGQRSGIDDARRYTDGHYLERGETAGNRGTRDGSQLVGAHLAVGDARHKRVDVDEARQREGGVARLEVDRRDVEVRASLAVASERLDKELGVLDVGDQRNGSVDRQSSRTVTHRSERHRSSVLVLAWQRDEERRQTRGQVREQRVGCLVRVLELGLVVLGQSLEVHLRVRLDGQVEHDLGGHLNGVNTSDLADEGERSRGADVALDHLDVVVLGDELDVERTGDVKRSGDLGGGHLDAAHGLGVEVLRGQDERSVTRVHTGVLDVLGDVVHHHLAVLGDGVHLDLLGALEGQRDVVGRLATHRDDHTGRLLRVVDVEHSLERDVLKVQTVGLVIVGRNGLGVVVDHDRLEAALSQRADGTHGTPVELDRRTDAVDTGAQHHDTLVAKVDVVLDSVVGGVEVVGVSGELGGDRVDLLDEGHDGVLLTQLAHGELGRVERLGELLVRESELLGLTKHGGREAGGVVGAKHLVGVHDAHQLAEEPAVDVAHLVDLVDRVALGHGVGDGEHALVRGVDELLVDLVVGDDVVRAETVVLVVDGSDGLLDRLLEGATDAHDLADTLHGRPELAADADKLAQIPSGELGDDVVERRLEAGAGLARDAVADLVEGDVETELGSDEGKRVSGGLGGKRRGSRETGVDLDDAVLALVRVERILDVALTDDTEMTDDVDGGGSEHVVIVVAERLRGGNDDRVTRVDTERVKVLHVADSDAVVAAITHDLVLDLLPALHRLFDEHLGRVGKGSSAELAQLLDVVGETGAETAERESGTDDDGEADRLGGSERLVPVVGGGRRGALLADLLHGLGEEVTVLGGDDGVDGRTKDLDTHLGELVLDLDTDVERGLTTKGAVDTVRSLVLDDLEHKLGGDGEEVDLVGETSRGLDGGDVGVDEHGVDALLLERLDGLRTGVVELTGLADRETTGAEDEHLADVDTGGLGGVLGVDTTGEADGGQDGGRGGARSGLDGGAVNDTADEDVEEELGVTGTGRALGVELDTEVGAFGGVDTLVGVVVGVGEEGLPASGEGVGVDGETVVLGGDVAAAADLVGTGDVVATVTELELLGLGTGGESEQLVTETDTEDGDHVGALALEQLGDAGDGGAARDRVTGTVGDEETVEGGDVGEEVVVPRDDVELDAAGGEASNLVVLHTDVERKDADGATGGVEEWSVELAERLARGGVGRGVELGLLARDASDEVLGVGVGEGEVDDGLAPVAGGGGLDDGGAGLGREELAEHATLVADLLGQGAGVDAVDGGDSALLEPVREAGLGEVVAELVAVVRHDETGHVNAARFEGGGQQLLDALGSLLSAGNTVVAGKREGENEDLTLVRGVRSCTSLRAGAWRRGLCKRRSRGIGLTSLEDTLSGDGLALGTEADTAVSGTIGKLEDHLGAVLLTERRARGGGIEGDLAVGGQGRLTCSQRRGGHGGYLKGIRCGERRGVRWWWTMNTIKEEDGGMGLSEGRFGFGLASQIEFLDLVRPPSCLALCRQRLAGLASEPCCDSPSSRHALRKREKCRSRSWASIAAAQSVESCEAERWRTARLARSDSNFVCNAPSDVRPRSATTDHRLKKLCSSWPLVPTWPKLDFLLEAVEPLGGEMGASSTDDEKTEPAPAGHWPASQRAQS